VVPGPVFALIDRAVSAYPSRLENHALECPAGAKNIRREAEAHVNDLRAGQEIGTKITDLACCEL
jgi:hypothetical protein